MGQGYVVDGSGISCRWVRDLVDWSGISCRLVRDIL